MLERSQRLRVQTHPRPLRCGTLRSRCDRRSIALSETAPWALIRGGDLASANAILRSLLETLRVIAAELAPFLPRTAAQLSDALQVPQHCGRAAWNALADGARLPQTLNLFPRFAPEQTRA
jgi:methionyl-tRNA synthetase